MNKRLERISQLIKKELSIMLIRQLSDKGLGFISITDVIVTPDLSKATIYYSQIGSEKERNETKKILASLTRYVRSEMAKVLHLKTVPVFSFVFDPSLERGAKVLEKMKQLRHE